MKRHLTGHCADRASAENGQGPRKQTSACIENGNSTAKNGVGSLPKSNNIHLHLAGPEVSLQVNSGMRQAWGGRNRFLDLVFRICQERRPMVFAMCCVCIAIIGLLDTWLAVQYSECIFDMEMNPICLYLMELEPQGLATFVYGKLAGIVVVLSVLMALFRYWPQVAMQVTLAVTFFQFSLVSYLYVISDWPYYYLILFQT